MIYRIPHIAQPERSNFCVPACAEMAVRALGYDYSMKELAELMLTNVDKKGTNFADASVALNSLGFKITFYEQLAGLPPVFKSKPEKLISFFKHHGYPHHVRAIKNDVKFIPESSTINIINNKIKQGFIPIVAVRPYIFYRDSKYRNTSHAIIIKKIDFDKNMIYVIDPQPSSKKHATEKYSINHFENSRSFTTSRAIFIK